MNGWWTARLGLAGAISLLTAATCLAAEQPAPSLDTAFGAYLAAHHAQQDHDYAAAAQFLAQVLATDAHNQDLLRRSFLMRLSAGDVAAAVPLAQQLTARDGPSGVAGLLLMEQDMKAGNYDAAAAIADKMPREGAQRFAVPLLLAWADVGRHQPDAALEVLNGMGDLHALEPLRDLHVALIDDYADRLDAADAAYAKISGPDATSSSTARVIDLAGNFYERHSRGGDARRLYQEDVARADGATVGPAGLARLAQGTVPPRVIASPADGASEALFDLAGLMNQPQTMDAALLYARLAIDLSPNFALARILVAEISDDQHRPAVALALYQSVPDSSPFHWMATLRAAMSLETLDRPDEAEAQLRQMAAAQPKKADALITLGDMLRAHKQYAEAATAYDQAFARLPPDQPKPWRLYYSRGIALERAGDWPRAEADLKQALVLQPDQPMVLNYLGYSWVDKGQNLTEALKMIQAAVAQQPNDGYVIDSLGWAYYRTGDVPDALQFLQRAIELVPEDPTINDHLGDVYWASGRLSEARSQWRRALQFKPDADEAKDLESKLDHGLGSARREPCAAAEPLSVAPRSWPAPAKLNLYLHVVGRRPDGYHLLDSLVAFADIGDSITAEPADRLTLDLTGPFAAALAGPAADNLVWRAATALADHLGREAAARLTLVKNLPIASGIGGGSSDAAATLLALRALWQAPVDDAALAALGAGLGADVPVCLAGRTAWLGGIGERVAPAPSLPPCAVLLVNPRIGLSTPAVFKARQGAFSRPARFTEAPRDTAALAALLAERRNDLAAAAEHLVPEIGAVLARLRTLDGASIARMSGSGATCFALFAEMAAAETAAVALRRAQPGWWIAAGRLI